MESSRKSGIACSHGCGYRSEESRLPIAPFGVPPFGRTSESALRRVIESGKATRIVLSIFETPTPPGPFGPVQRGGANLPSYSLGGLAASMPSELEAALLDLRAEIRHGGGARVRLFRPIKGARRVTFPPRQPGDAQGRVIFTRDGRVGYARSLAEITYADLVLCHPMRDFSRRRGQSNKPVAYFSRTVGDLVGCESQHERRFALIADWRTEVVHIAAQPFTVEFPEGSEFESHTPDFVLITADGQVIAVDVKWPTREFNEKDARRHRLVREQLAVASIHHEVWFDAPPTFTENLANFAGARVPDPLFNELGPQVLELAKVGMSISRLQASVAASGVASAMVALVVIRRLLWEQRLHIDVARAFSLESELR